MSTTSEATEAPPTQKTPQCFACKAVVCDFCGCCHVEACVLYNKAAYTKSDLAGMSHLFARTQKARGYALIARELNVPKPFAIVTDPEEVARAVDNIYGTVFVRPCPIRPRHGFVESRAVEAENRTQTILDILAEAKTADPEAELLLVPAIKASHNVILTPARMAIGPGNDGATAGRKSSVFPLAGVPFHELPPALITQAGVGTDEDPYVEAVIRHGDLRNVYLGVSPTNGVFFTQLRAGAKISSSVGVDFIPEAFTVERVLEASGDLLEWERQVKEEIKPGTAVYHLGGTLVSHYGVHCVFHNIPMLTSRKPEVGEHLVPTHKPERPKPQAVIEGLGIGISEKYIGITLSADHEMPMKGTWDVTLQANQAATVLLTAAHNAVAMTGEDGRWIGIAVALMMRLGMAASHGEARHKKDAESWGSYHTRALVYKLALNNFFEARQSIGCAQWRFKNLKWAGSYGGPKWADCTESILRMDRAAQALIRTPSDEAVTELVSALHYAINRAHNGGWWLNKFVKQRVFDETCKQSMYSLCVAAPLILNIAQMKVNYDDVHNGIDRWAKEAEPALVQGYEIEGPTYDPADQPTGVSVGGTPTVPFDTKCGETGCTACYPQAKAEAEAKKAAEKAAAEEAKAALSLANKYTEQQASKSYFSMKAAGNVNKQVTLTPGSEVIEAQAQHSSAQIHVQYKVKGIKGYFSFNRGLSKVPPHVDCTQPSYSGSGNLYYPLTVEKDPAHMAYRFSNKDAGIDFVYTLQEGS